jgi:hypothetical protein
MSRSGCPAERRARVPVRDACWRAESSGIRGPATFGIFFDHRLTPQREKTIRTRIERHRTVV